MTTTRTYWACPDPRKIAEKFLDNEEPVQARREARDYAGKAFQDISDEITEHANLFGCTVLSTTMGEPSRNVVSWIDDRVWYPMRATFQGERADEIRQHPKPYSDSPFATKSLCDPYYLFAEGIQKLAAGNFKEGWPLYEHRLNTEQMLPQRKPFTMPMWDGVTKGRVLIHAEQGFGDCIHFSRWLRELPVDSDFLCYSDLCSLMKTLDYDGVVSCDESMIQSPRYDFHLPICSLPAALGITEAKAVGAYLFADSAKSDRFDVSAGLARGNVGIVWGGRPVHANNAGRSVTIEQIIRACPEGHGIYSLQKGEYREQLKHLPPGLKIVDWTNDLHDWSDTAALIDRLDCVVTVDTAVAHLCGAMGKPVKMLMAGSKDWRWLSGATWYKSLSIIRSEV